METNPSARTSRTYWCPRPVARRLPLFGKQPCICEHLSGESGVPCVARPPANTLVLRLAGFAGHAPHSLYSAKHGGAGRLRSVSSALQVRRAAIITTAPRWTRRRDSHPRPSALQAGPLAARARREKNRTAAQVTRREKTSLTSVLSDRGLRSKWARRELHPPVRVKSPLHRFQCFRPGWSARGELHPDFRLGGAACCFCTTRA